MSSSTAALYLSAKPRKLLLVMLKYCFSQWTETHSGETVNDLVHLQNLIKL